LGLDETVFDFVAGETFKSGFAAVGVNKLANERERKPVHWKGVGRRSTHLITGICLCLLRQYIPYDKQQQRLKKRRGDIARWIDFDGG
jgi:hypothetical protein